MSKALRVGIDIHGVLDEKIITEGIVRKWMTFGHEIHIITGESWGTAMETVKSLDIPHDYHFSIVDYHMAKGTKMEKRDTGWYMENDEWDRAKGDYCHRESIDIMFDDTARYSIWMPPKTNFVLIDDRFRLFVKAMSDLSGIINKA
jgi:hypothetical protein